MSIKPSNLIDKNIEWKTRIRIQIRNKITFIENKTLWINVKKI